VQGQVLHMPVRVEASVLSKIRLDCRAKLHICTVLVKVEPDAVEKCRIKAFLNRLKAGTQRAVSYKEPSWIRTLTLYSRQKSVSAGNKSVTNALIKI